MTATKKRRFDSLSKVLMSTAAIVVATGLWIAGIQAAMAIQPQQEEATDVSLADPYTLVRGASEDRYIASVASLTQEIDNTVTPSEEGGVAYNQTEALSKTIPDSSAISAKLTLDADWEEKPVRVGLWGEVFSAADEAVIPGYPIIEFTTVGENDFTGFRVYDTHGDTPAEQKWINLTGIDFEWGRAYDLKIAFRESDEKYVFFVDGKEVLSLDASRSDNDNSPRDTFRSMLFVMYNSMTPNGVADNYSATWTNAKRFIMVDTPNVVELGNASNSQAVTIATPAGTAITDSSAVAAPEEYPDGDNKYPLGLINFSFTTTQTDNLVTLTFVTDLKPNEVVARKYNPTTHEYTTIEGASIAATTVDGKAALSLSYAITDNGDLDLDPVIGRVSDPVGLAVLPGVPNTGLQASSKTLVIAASVGGVILLAVSIVLGRRTLRNHA